MPKPPLFLSLKIPLKRLRFDFRLYDVSPFLTTSDRVVMRNIIEITSPLKEERHIDDERKTGTAIVELGEDE